MAKVGGLETTTDTTEGRVLAGLDGLAVWSKDDSGPVVQSVLAALIYADLFDYPLALDELVRYSVGTTISRADVLTALENSAVLRAHVHCSDSYYHLAGRSSLVALRK